MLDAIRRALYSLPFVVVAAVIASACSGSSAEDGAVGTGGSADSALGVNILGGGAFITIENRADQVLLDVVVTANPLGGRTPYTTTIRRLEVRSKRELSLGDLREPQGAPINPNLVKLKELVVTATDHDGKKYEVRLPWKG